MAFIAGQYTCTWDANSTGQIKDGIRVDHTFSKRKIRGDNHADSDQDAVFRGGNVYVQFTMLEFNGAAAPAIFWPYGASYLQLGLVGILDTSIAQALVLTALTGTNAQTIGAPNTLTMNKTVIADGYPVSMLFAPDEREVPIRLQAYPYFSGSPGPTTCFYGVLT